MAFDAIDLGDIVVKMVSNSGNKETVDANNYTIKYGAGSETCFRIVELGFIDPLAYYLKTA